MRLDKGAANGPFISFFGDADPDTTSAISTLANSGATTHHIKMTINSQTVWIPCSTNNPT